LRCIIASRRGARIIAIPYAANIHRIACRGASGTGTWYPDKRLRIPGSNAPEKMCGQVTGSISHERSRIPGSNAPEKMCGQVTGSTRPCSFQVTRTLRSKRGISSMYVRVTGVPHIWIVTTSLAGSDSKETLSPFTLNSSSSSSG